MAKVTIILELDGAGSNPGSTMTFIETSAMSVYDGEDAVRLTQAAYGRLVRACGLALAAPTPDRAPAPDATPPPEPDNKSTPEPDDDPSDAPPPPVELARGTSRGRNTPPPERPKE